MCGIAGVFGDASHDRLRAMADSLAHRGPDDEGVWQSADGGIGVAYRRLAIIDPEGGRQPMGNEDGRIVTVFNGEIYNHSELRVELEARGHRFRSACDTEVIVHLYEEHGVDLAARLRGMFAIAVWDEEAKRLVLIRDRVGKKPLYYREAAGEFLFASEIKGVLAGSPTAPSLSKQAVADYLTFGVVPAPSTIYEHIHSLRPGEVMVVRDRRIESRRRYWQARMLPKVNITRGDAVDQIDERLREAVRIRLRSDVPVGCFLSGGLDSGIITAMAAEMHTGPLTTITVGFEDGVFDERGLARLVARRYGTDHRELVIRPDVAADLPAIAAAYDQPFGDSSAIPSYYVAREARSAVKVVLNGDGGDEVFAGYRRYVAGWLSGRLWWADTPDGRDLLGAIARRLPVPGGYRSAYAFGHRLLRGLSLEPAARYLAWAIDAFDRPGLTEIGRDAGDGWLAHIQPGERLPGAVLAGLRECGPIDRMLGADLAMGLPDDLLVKMDIATMAHGLEARSPLLDHVLIDTVCRFPERLKLSGFTTKPLLRALGRRYVSREVQDAPKRGFEVPLVRWLRGPLRALSMDVLLARHGLVADLFDRRALHRLLSNGQGLDPARWSRRVWLLLMLGLWDQAVFKKSDERL
ncbi:MAG: asparagine synthase (glutamine-hydrolyzing) [Phycisphaerae bacterium]